MPRHQREIDELRGHPHHPQRLQVGPQVLFVLFEGHADWAPLHGALMTGTIQEGGASDGTTFTRG